MSSDAAAVYKQELWVGRVGIIFLLLKEAQIQDSCSVGCSRQSPLKLGPGMDCEVYDQVQSLVRQGLFNQEVEHETLR